MNAKKKLEQLGEIKKVIDKHINDPSVEFDVEDVNCVSLNYIDTQFTELSKVNEDVKFVEGELKKRGYSFDPCVVFTDNRYDSYGWDLILCLRWYQVDPGKKELSNMHECPKDCLSCANSFSEPAENENESDVLHCMEKDGQVVSETDCCDEYN